MRHDAMLYRRAEHRMNVFAAGQSGNDSVAHQGTVRAIGFVTLPARQASLMPRPTAALSDDRPVRVVPPMSRGLGIKPTNKFVADVHQG